VSVCLLAWVVAWLERHLPQRVQQQQMSWSEFHWPDCRHRRSPYDIAPPSNRSRRSNELLAAIETFLGCRSRCSRQDRRRRNLRLLRRQRPAANDQLHHTELLEELTASSLITQSAGSATSYRFSPPSLSAALSSTPTPSDAAIEDCVCNTLSRHIEWTW
jgi:hypothetical protein